MPLPTAETLTDSQAIVAEQTYSHGNGLRRTASNVVSMLTANVFQKASVFLTYILVVRYLGAYQFGQLALATTLLDASHTLALFGLKTFLTREVARHRQVTVTYFLHASSAGLFTAAIGIVLIFSLATAMNYHTDTVAVIFLTSIALPALVLSQISEGVFQGWERMHFIAYVHIPVSILRIVATFVLLHFDFGIHVVAISLAASHFLVLLLQWLLLTLSMGLDGCPFDIRLTGRMLRSASTFLAIQGTIAIQVSGSVVILSYFCGETGVGLYSAASQILVPLYLVCNSIAFSLFPVMCRSYDLSVERLAAVVRTTTEFVLAIALPVVAAVFLLADVLLIAIYHDRAFLTSSNILRIIVCLPLQGALTAVMGQALWASQRERLALRIAMVNMSLQLALGLFAISQFGLYGAAATTMSVAVVSLIQHYIPIRALLPGFSLITAAWKPLCSTAAMAAILICFRDLNLVLLICLSATWYCLILAALFIWSAGGFHHVKSLWVQLWTT